MPTLRHWFADGAYLGSSAPGVAFAYAPSHAGRVQLTVSDERGGNDARALVVRLAE